MRVLLDTCVLSELNQPGAHPGVRRAVNGLDPGDVFVSVLTVGAIEKGIGRMPEGRRRSELRRWLQAIERDYAAHLLPVDLEVSRIWGEITAVAQRDGRVEPATDGLIAATARRHGLHVMTRNTADFEPTGVLVMNPWLR